MGIGFYDVDGWVAEAIERGDFKGAREQVHSNSQNLSANDQRTLLEAIGKAESEATAIS